MGASPDSSSGQGTATGEELMTVRRLPQEPRLPRMPIRF